MTRNQKKVVYVHHPSKNLLVLHVLFLSMHALKLKLECNIAMMLQRIVSTLPGDPGALVQRLALTGNIYQKEKESKREIEREERYRVERKKEERVYNSKEKKMFTIGKSKIFF